MRDPKKTEKLQMRSAPRRRTRGSFPVASTTVEASASGAIGPPSTASAASPESSASAACTVSAFGCPEWFALVWASGQPIRRKTARTSGWSGTRNRDRSGTVPRGQLFRQPFETHAVPGKHPPIRHEPAERLRSIAILQVVNALPGGRVIGAADQSVDGLGRQQDHGAGPGERFENGVRRSIDAGFGQFQHTGHPIRPPRPAGRAPSAAPARRGSSR